MLLNVPAPATKSPVRPRSSIRAPARRTPAKSPTVPPVRLDADDVAWMSCLAGIGGRVSGLMANAAAAPTLLAVDGCPQDCAKKTLEIAGFTNVKHVRVSDLGFKKGKSPASDEAIGRVAAAASALLKN